MKFCSSVADIFKIKHTQFGYDAFRFDISILHYLGLQFFRGHSVYNRIHNLLMLIYCALFCSNPSAIHFIYLLTYLLNYLLTTVAADDKLQTKLL